MYQFLLFIPIIIAITWAVFSLYKKGDRHNAIIILIAGIVTLVNGILRTIAYSSQELLPSMDLVQQVASSLIVPIAYVYFSRQVGRSYNNESTILQLVFILFILFPNITIFTDGTSANNLTEPLNIESHSICFISGGECFCSFKISEFVMAMQALVTLTRVIPFHINIKNHGLVISRDLYVFYCWWFFAAIFIILNSVHNMWGISSETFSWYYSVGVMLLSVSIFIMLANGFDLRPLIVCDDDDDDDAPSDSETDEDVDSLTITAEIFSKKKAGIPVSLDTYLLHTHDLARRFRKMLDDEHVYLIPGYTKEKAVAELGTNRTYFAQMLKTEFGCSFSELLNELRIEEVKKMLLTTDRTLLEMADHCGFSSHSYMSKVFKQKTGLTPIEWKEKSIYQSVV